MINDEIFWNKMKNTIVEFNDIKRELYHVYCSLGLFRRASDTNSENFICASGYRWHYMFHGKGILFRRITRHPVSINILDTSFWYDFDAWTLQQYIRTKKASCPVDRQLKSIELNEIESLLEYFVQQGSLQKSTSLHRMYTEGVLVQPISSASNPQVSDAIFREKLKSEQFDTKKSIDNSAEK